jgi:hypothetical protein
MGKEGLRKGVFISGDYGKRRDAYRERERKRASVGSVTAFSTVSMGWRVEFSRKEGLWYFVSRMVYRRAEKGKDSAFGIG